MSTTTLDPDAAGGAADDPPARPGPGPAYYARQALAGLASLRLTVVLFALGTALVFFGTVAMMASGLWTIVDQYFRSAVVWVPFDLFRRFGTVFFDLPKEAPPWRGAFPFPGGWLIGSVLLANLVAAHLVRFKLTWRRSGIIVLHAGMILLMVGELVTGLYAVESTMTIRKGETIDFVDVTRDYEIAVVDRRDPKDDRVVVVPHHLFAAPGWVRDEQLPFDLEVTDYWRNTAEERSVAPFPPGTADVFPVGLPTGPKVWFRLTPRGEGAGVDSDARADIPSVRVRAVDRATGAELTNTLLSLWAYPNFELNRRVYRFPPAKVSVGGVEYTLELRNKRVYKPYRFELLDFEHGLYPGTDIPKDFASTVRVTDPAAGDDRTVRIWMNNPLRYQGESFYQHAVMYEDSGTVLQVVRNPGRLLPYLACGLVTLGMLVHFGLRLSRFQQSQRMRAAP